MNVCYAIRTSQLFNTPNMSRSAYVAKVEAKDCVACGRCVEYCPAGAVKLGQKLCKKDGSQVEYPKHVLPSEKKWGPEMWDETTVITTASTAMTLVQLHVNSLSGTRCSSGLLKNGSTGKIQDARR